MDLKEFYFQNIKESEYHHRFLNSVKKVNYTYNPFTGEEETQDYQFEIYDVEEAITKFKELCQPDVNFSPENKCWFYLITYAERRISDMPQCLNNNISKHNQQHNNSYRQQGMSERLTVCYL